MKVNIKTPITYYGGKQSILKHILPLVPPHKRYTEAFLGGAALFFAKEPAPSEVINDLDGNLIQFYHVAQTNYPALKERIDATLHSRDTHTQGIYLATLAFTSQWISLGQYGFAPSRASPVASMVPLGTTLVAVCQSVYAMPRTLSPKRFATDCKR